jgi:hypothetical protein
MNNLKVSRAFTRKPRPEYSVDCLICAMFVRQRIREGKGGVVSVVQTLFSQLLALKDRRIQSIAVKTGEV